MAYSESEFIDKIMSLYEEDLNENFFYKTENIQNATKKTKAILHSILKEEFLS